MSVRDNFHLQRQQELDGITIENLLEDIKQLKQEIQEIKNNIEEIFSQIGNLNAIVEESGEPRSYE